ncbi:MAG: choice-of-anchor B family protein [Flavobacteriales bacterium]
MKKSLLLFLVSMLHLHVLGQFSIDSLSHIDYQALHGANLNDVWGYVDELGNEYAIVGTSTGTSIVNITNGAQPQEVFWLAGSESIWRDPCVFGDYAYVTTEAEDGLLIIDLSPLPQSVNLNYTFYTGPAAAPWQSAHTCYTSPTGYAYIFGANRGNGGVIMLDLNVNPMAPIEVGTYDPFYVHDGFERNDTLYVAHIYDGFFSILNVADKANPVLLATQSTPNFFTHNIWPSANGQVVYTTDEISGAYVASYDISNLQQITALDRVQNGQGTSVIPHNVHVKGAYLITSYYSDGVVFHDANDPENLIKLGSYDTYPGQTPGFDGCWGVYPFFPSDKAVAADITKGLFILQVNYAPAASLTGVVKNLMTGIELDHVSVSLVGAPMTELTNTLGIYKTGIAQTGSYVITFNKPGFYPQTLTVNLVTGQQSTLNVNLLPIPPYQLEVQVLETGTNLPISNAKIAFKHPQITHTGTTNGLGLETLTLFYQDAYDIVVGKWGYHTKCTTLTINASTQNLTFYLEKGFYDDFSFDFGWSVIGNAQTGMWERGKAMATTQTVMDSDVALDCEDLAMYTGLGSTVHPDAADVDNGFTQLISPVFTAAGLSTPHLNYASSFFCYHGPGAFSDTLLITLSNGLQEVVLEQIIGPQGQPMQWEYKSWPLSGLLDLTGNLQLFIRTADYAGNPNITEAAFDHFSLTNEPVIGQQDPITPFLEIAPNPGNESIQIRGLENEQLVTVMSSSGAVLHQQFVGPTSALIDTRNLSVGIYFIHVGMQTIKWVKAAN